MQLEVRDLSVAIHRKPIVSGVSLTVGDGEFVGMLGPNGCGKSTTLRAIYRLNRKYSGQIMWDGRDERSIAQKEFARRVAVVSQFNDIAFDFTVREVVLMGRAPHMGMLTRETDSDQEIVAQSLDMVDMAHFSDRSFASLSGGEKQRVILARALAQKPEFLILDEPTNHLDIYMRESLTQALAAYTGTLLLVTHDRYLMQTLGCPIMYLEDGKATFYPSFAALQNRDAGKTQEQQKTEDTAKKQAYGKEQRKRRAEVRARLKKVESEIEELGAHIVELENEINDPEVLRDHLLLRDKCDELDDTRFHQQELYDEWEKLAEEQETFENEGE